MHICISILQPGDASFNFIACNSAAAEASWPESDLFVLTVQDFKGIQWFQVRSFLSTHGTAAKIGWYAGRLRTSCKLVAVILSPSPPVLLMHVAP